RVLSTSILFSLDIPLLTLSFIFLSLRPTPTSTLFPYTTLFRSRGVSERALHPGEGARVRRVRRGSALTQRYEIHLRGAHEGGSRSEEHTSELQSLRHLVCRLLLEKKKNYNILYFFFLNLITILW